MNKVVVKGSPQAVENFVKSAINCHKVMLEGKTAVKPFTFETAIPMPPTMAIEASSDIDAIHGIIFGQAPSNGSISYRGQTFSSKQEAIDWIKQNNPDGYSQAYTQQFNLETYGAPNWYEWSCRNWGTKWDAYDVYLGAVKLTPKGKKAHYNFEFLTAWAPPLPVLQALADMFPDCSIHLDWEEEGGDSGKEVFSAY